MPGMGGGMPGMGGGMPGMGGMGQPPNMPAAGVQASALPAEQKVDHDQA